MTDDWSPPPSAAAKLDEEHYQAHLRNVAADLTANEMPRRASPAPRSKYVTDAALSKLLGRIGQLVGQTIRERCEKLEKRVAELEAQRGLKYLGPWKAGAYNPGEFVSYAGGIWHCKQSTGKRPTQCHESWALAVKSGAK